MYPKNQIKVVKTNKNIDNSKTRTYDTPNPNPWKVLINL